MLLPFPETRAELVEAWSKGIECGAIVGFDNASASSAQASPTTSKNTDSTHYRENF